MIIDWIDMMTIRNECITKHVLEWELMHLKSDLEK